MTHLEILFSTLCREYHTNVGLTQSLNTLAATSGQWQHRPTSPAAPPPHHRSCGFQAFLCICPGPPYSVALYLPISPDWAPCQITMQEKQGLATDDTEGKITKLVHHALKLKAITFAVCFQELKGVNLLQRSCRSCQDIMKRKMVERDK